MTLRAAAALALLGLGPACNEKCDLPRFDDVDGDGYGDPATERAVCDEALYPGEAREGGDCDDADEGVNPGAEEACDGLDNDCDGAVDEGLGDAAEGFVDADGDGFGAESTTGCPGTPGFSLEGGDCDDADEAVFPGAAELCDGADGDCDGAVDEEPADGTPHYVDADGDGFGDPESPTSACGAGAGVSANADDCDDGDAEVSPQSREACDGVDNDCDAAVDEAGEGLDWFPDGDGDGFGDPDGAPVNSCTAPGEAWAPNDGDCDDGDAAVNPDAAEVCLDGIDNDCSGDGAGCVLLGDYDLDADADVSFTGESSGGELGFLARSGRGDHDGDGVPDLALGAASSDSARGLAFVIDPVGQGAQTLSGAEARLSGGARGDELGVSVAWLGDHDGDGVDDLAVAAWRADGAASDAGAVYVFAGGVSDGDPSSADLVLEGEGRSDFFGTRVAGPGDLDGDGLGELLVGAWGDDTAGSNAGAAYLWYAPARSGTASDADVVLTGEGAGDSAGYHVAGAELDGDGRRDLLVSAVEADGRNSGSGVVYLVSGQGLTSGSLGDALRVGGNNTYDYFGWAAEDVGDVNCDGHHDLAVGAYGASGGRGSIYLFFGPLTVDTDTASADHQFDGVASGDNAGFALSPAGDLDRDGCDDLVIGAPYNDDGGGSDAGAAYLFYGPVEGWRTLNTPDARFLGSARYDYSGSLVQDLGDVNSDSVDDLLIGAFGAGSNDEGRVYVFHGGAP